MLNITEGQNSWKLITQKNFLIGAFSRNGLFLRDFEKFCCNLATLPMGCLYFYFLKFYSTMSVFLQGKDMTKDK